MIQLFIFMNTITRVDGGARMHAAHKAGGFIPPGECLVISRHGKVVAEANSGGTRATGESMLGSLSWFILNVHEEANYCPGVCTLLTCTSQHSLPATNCPRLFLVANQPPRDIRLFRRCCARRLREILTEDLFFWFTPCERGDFYHNNNWKEKKYGFQIDKVFTC